MLDRGRVTMSALPYEWQVGWRYLRGARRGGRRNRFVSFIAGGGTLGIALGVAALVVVLSVMNGFQKEVRARMLDVIPHIELVASGGRALADAPRTMREALGVPGVVAAAPFVAAQVLAGRGERLRGVLLRGIDPAAAPQVTALAARLATGSPAPLAALRPGSHASADIHRCVADHEAVRGRYSHLPGRPIDGIGVRLGMFHR